MGIVPNEGAVVEIAIDVTHVVTGILQKTKTSTPLEEITTLALAVIVLDQGRLTVIGTTDPEADPGVITKNPYEREALAVIATVDESGLQAPSPNLQHLNRLKTSVTEELSSCNSSLLD